MNLPLLSALFGGILICGICFILFGRSSYQQNEKTPFRFSNHFPFEFLNGFGFRYALLGRILVIGVGLGLILFSFFGFGFPNLYQAIFVMVGYLLGSFLWVALCLTDMRYVKLHIVLASLYFATIAFTSAAVSYFVFTSPYDIYHPSLSYVAAALSLVELVLAFNPSLKRWESLEAVTQADGTVTYERPKRFVLPFSEWLTTLVFLALTGYIVFAAIIN